MRLVPGWNERLAKVGWRQGYLALCSLVWAVGVLTLPITSLPLLIDLTRASTVAPPAAMAFLLLAVIWLAPYLLRGGRMPAESVPLVLFMAAVLVTWALAFFREVPPLRGRTMLMEAPEAAVTLGIGLAAFFVTAVWVSREPRRLSLTLQLLNWGGLVLFAWSLVQIAFIYLHNNRFPFELVQLQNAISSRHNPLFPGRITGMAYEPSWLAHQLNMVFLPYWLAASLMRFSAHRFKLGRVTFENFLLVGGVVMLAASFSRVGWLSFLLVLGYLALWGNLWLAGRVQERLSGSRVGPGGRKKAVRWAVMAVLVVAFMAVYGGVILGVVYVGSRFDPRLAALFEGPLVAGSIYEITNELSFAERLIYWETGWRVFNQHLLFGVGLGNTGFYFIEQMPAFGWGLPEITDLLYHLAVIPNSKSMWVRILAETGLFGFIFFISWLYLLWQSSRASFRSQERLHRVMGLAGHFIILSFLIEGFSVDSFALPYFWFATGLVAAVGALARREGRMERGAAVFVAAGRPRPQ